MSSNDIFILNILVKMRNALLPMHEKENKPQGSHLFLNTLQKVKTVNVLILNARCRKLWELAFFAKELNST